MVDKKNAAEFGVDAGKNPKLALALRVSLEEQRRRQVQRGCWSKDGGWLAKRAAVKTRKWTRLQAENSWL